MAFEKGKSGNPGGRPKDYEEIRALARRHGNNALAKLVSLMNSDDERVAADAAKALLDRGYGKPTQSIAGHDGGPLQVMEVTRRIIDPKA